MGASDGGQGKTASYNPALDYAMQVAQYSALDPLGFGMISSIPDPWQQLIGQINNSPMDGKTRRRALAALDAVRQDPTLLSDPYGTSFTRDQIFAANKDARNLPFGRVVQRASEGSSGGISKLGGGLGGAAIGSMLGPIGSAIGAGLGSLAGSSNDTKPVALPIRNVGRLSSALKGAGLNLSDLKSVLERQAQYKAQIERLRAAGLDKLNEDTILNRAHATAAANALLGDAGRFATGAAPTEFQTGLLDRINRNINEQEQQYLLRAQYGGFNPGTGIQGFQQMRQDSEITGLTQAVQAASALMSGLAGGTQGAQQAAQQSSQSSLGALGIAANQAMAANQLSQAGSFNRADSLANGLAGGANQIGQSMLLSSLFNQQGRTPATSSAGTGTESGGWRFYNQPWG